MAARGPPKLNPDVKIAAEFLRDLYQKGYYDADLRKYLIQTRGMDVELVDEAFRVHGERLALEEGKESSGSSVEVHLQASDQWQESLAHTKMGHPRRKSNDAERPERVMREEPQELRNTNTLSFLLPQRQTEGEVLFKKFLVSERNYCITLECLKDEYHIELVRMADQGQFSLTRKEIDNIFHRIPALVRFHKVFYTDMKEGSNIGRMFVRLLEFFKGYSKYMEHCMDIILKMRAYTRDKRLHKSLKRIKQRSRRSREDMWDLLLTPLSRMTDYKKFLDQLYEWGDNSQKADYEFLGKAARRIGRIAEHIERYRYGISNRNELNKVQTFIGKQLDIITPNRRIVRRGLIIRRTTGWAARNKYCIFFLFNDSLLWTNRKGELQNVVQLRHCELFPSDAKRDANRKFKIVVKSLQQRKTLLMDCLSVRQRTDWYNALEKTIGEARKTSEKAWSKEVLPFKDENSDEEIVPQNLMPPKKCKPTHDDDDNNSVTTDLSYDDRYEDSFNFDSQEFKEIPPMEETVSEISDFDQDFLVQYEKYPDAGNSGATASLISPFLGSESSPSMLPIHTALLAKTSSERTERDSFSSSGGSFRDDIPIMAPGPRRSSIIRRGRRDSHEETVRLRRSSSLNISLCDELLTPTQNEHEIGTSFAIRLNDCEK